MSEFPGQEGQFDDASIDAFMAEQERADQETTKNEEAINQTYAQILTTLDTMGAVHVWHPDPEIRGENEAKIRDGQIEAGLYFIPEMMSDALKARLRMTEEATIVTLIAMSMTAAESVTPERRAAIDMSSKRTLARLMSRGFDESWQRAASELLGVTLDLSNDEDLRLYVEQSIEDETAELPPKMQAANSILNEGVELDDDNLNRIQAISARVGYLILTAERGEQQKANSIGQLYELASEGMITEAQRDELLRLLEQPEV